MKNSFIGREIIPANEKERIKALRRHKLIQDLPQGYFNNLANIMAQTFGTPIALVSIVRSENVVFPGNIGLHDTTSVPRGVSLCSLAVMEAQPTIFTDATKEPCLLANPLVAGEFGLRFYAGAPIITNDGQALGTVCIVDKEPRQFTDKELELLKGFAETAMQEIEQRTMNMQTVLEQE
jgi:GAF domain-containing protein